MAEAHCRSIVKAMTYRAGGTVITCIVAWALTGSLDLAAKVGALDTLVKIGFFYVHERAWNKLNFGRLKPPEFEI